MNIILPSKMKLVADAVVIGAGTAGCALAKRLSQAYSVILLEAGYDQTDDPDIAIPSRSGILVADRTNRYFYPLGHALPSEADASSNRRLPAVASETPGGGSSTNGMQWVESDAEYFNKTAELVGDPDWSASNVARVYKSIEKFNGISDYNPAAHGYSGPLDVKQVVVNQQAAEVFTQATSSVTGVPLNVDYNDPTVSLGSYRYWQVTQTPDSRRAESFSAYLKSGLVQDPKNPDVYLATDTVRSLQLVVRARLQQVHFDTQDKPRATGVTASVDGQKVTFCARKYVILCTGFQSCAYLQNFGIGDAVHLKALGLEVLVDNPNVGQHMLNHPILSLTGLVDPNGLSPFTPLPPGFDTEGLYSGGAQLPDATGQRGYQLIGIASPTAVGVAPVAFTAVGLILDAKSQGWIKIIDRDINRIPDFNFRYFSDPADIDSGISLYTTQYQILKAMGLLPQGPDPVTEPDGVRAFVLTRFSQAYHWVGMTRMANTAAEGVVSSSGRVFGTQNLYVADVGILPLNTAGNTQAPAYLIGNIIADKLIAKSKCRCRESIRTG